MKFKVGDKVRLSGYVDFGGYEHKKVSCDGLLGEVRRVDSEESEPNYYVTAKYPDGSQGYWFRADELQLADTAEPATLRTPQIGDVVTLNHGGPQGTIVNIKEDYVDKLPRACVYYSDSQEWFPLRCLRKVPDVSL